MLTVKRFINIPVASNCYLLFDKEVGDDCIVVDPGSRKEDELIAFLLRESLVPRYIILTHEHFDHCWGVNQLMAKYNIPVVCSELCADAIKYEKRNCSVFYDNTAAFVIKNGTESVESMGMSMKFHGYDIRFYQTPGHTDASISFDLGGFLFTGDTLIKEVRTVTKLPTGSKERLKLSMDLYALMKGKGYTVCPGHGEEFSINDFFYNSNNSFGK